MSLRTQKAWANLGGHGRIYVTMDSPHVPTRGRFEIYESEAAARMNQFPGLPIVECVITYKVPTKPKRK